MKILFIPYGTDKAPATRYRVTQYLPFLKVAGIGYRVFSAISRFSTNLMIASPEFKPAQKFLYYLYVFIERTVRSLYIIAAARKFNIVFLQRTTFPLRLELLLKAANKNIIFDIDDAIYMPDSQKEDIVTRLKRYIKENEVINILKVSTIAVVENDYIKNFVSRYCENVVKIPGPIDTDRFFVKDKQNSDRVTIGWIGSPATTGYLHMLDEVFKKISEKYNFVKFKFIGVGRYLNPEIRFENIEWTYGNEVAELQSFDIGVMPMPDNEWTRGKLGCKMLQYMAVGIPAVVSYTPTNTEIIKDEYNGFFASTEDEWTVILSRLIEDKDARNEIGQKGRQTALEKCSLSADIDKYMSLFHSFCTIPQK